jgi:hypothetical protein
MAFATGLAAGWLALLVIAAIFGHFCIKRIELGWARWGYWLSFGLIQIAALISAQGIERELARASQGGWKLPWRVALPLICFGVFLFLLLYCATGE